MKYKLLDQRSPKYNEPLWNKIHWLYEGGEILTNNVQKLVPRHYNESQQAYKERITKTAYINYFGSLVDEYVGKLFSKELSVLPAGDATDDSTPGDVPQPEFYQEFSMDCDLAGTTFNDLLKDAVTDALCFQKAFIGIDFPKADQKPETLLEEEESGTNRAYLYEVPIWCILDWQEDEFDNFTRLVIKKTIEERPSMESPYVKKDQFMVWQLKDGVVTYQKYEIPWVLNKPPRPTDDVPLVDEGTVSFSCIPIVKLCIPSGLWIGNKLVNIAKEMLNRRSSLVSSQDNSLHAVPVLQLGPEMSAPGEALPSTVQQDETRGNKMSRVYANNGFMVIGAGDDVKYLEPNGQCFELVTKQLKDLVDEMHRICQKMANSISNTSQALGRSGLSKQQDHASEETILNAYGALASAYAKKIFDIISKARGENIIWSPTGLDDYKSVDRTELLQESLAISNLEVAQASPTFRKLFLYNQAINFVDGIPPETSTVIRTEIDTYVDQAHEMAEEMRLNPPEEDNAASDNTGDNSDNSDNASGVNESNKSK